MQKHPGSRVTHCRTTAASWLVPRGRQMTFVTTSLVLHVYTYLRYLGIQSIEAQQLRPSSTTDCTMYDAR